MPAIRQRHRLDRAIRTVVGPYWRRLTMLREMLLVTNAKPARRRFFVRIAVLESLYAVGWTRADRLAEIAGYAASAVRRALTYLRVNGLARSREVRDGRVRHLEHAA